MPDEAPQLKARLKKLMSKREALKEITKRPGVKRSEDLVKEKERLEEILDEFVMACKGAHKLKEVRFNDVNHDLNAPLVLQSLNRVYKALTQGGKPSDYERT